MPSGAPPQTPEDWLMNIRRLIAVAFELTSEMLSTIAAEINPPKKRPPRTKPTAKPNWWEGVMKGDR